MTTSTPTLGERWPNLDFGQLVELLDEGIDRLSHHCAAEWLAWQTGDASAVEVAYFPETDQLWFTMRGRHVLLWPDRG